MKTKQESLLNQALELGLKEDEYRRIVEELGREPTKTEIAMYSVMWSEHCAYKHSRLLLKKFPTKADYVLCGPGENAGIIDIGDGLAVAIKAESHNHPSAVEPYQGAATGVGGIVRDIFTMGARPIALMDSLRFGNLAKARQKYLLDGVVAGIAGYGNTIGVPTVGGEIYFEDSYEGNCLVNVLCIGLIEKGDMITAVSKGPGNPVVLMGSKTGRDGIGGCSVLASEEFDETSESKRPSVQVGNPLMEKLLIEACLELKEKDLIVALQDFGAAGITCSSCEMSAKGQVGMDLDLGKVERREAGMEPFEIMMSESQERMMAVVEPSKVDEFLQVCEKWEVPATVIGKVNDDGQVRISDNGEMVADLRASSLADDVPIYHPEAQKPAYIDELTNKPLDIKEPSDYNKVLLDLIASPNLCSRHYVFEQYDHMVQTNTAVLPGSDAAVLRIKNSNKALAITIDCNSRYTYLDPRAGAKIALAEAARNIVASGGKPLAITDCLNFGNPEKPAIFWQFKEAVEGLADACDVLGTPVVSGNVSFYNESFSEAIYPTPTVGMVGLIEDLSHITTIAFRENKTVALLGDTKPELGGSEYLKVIEGKIQGRPPEIDLEKEKNLQQAVLEAIKEGLVSSAHDLSEGGLTIALSESCLAGNVGATIESPSDVEYLFSETQGRMLVSFNGKDSEKIENIAAKYSVPFHILGATGGTNLKISGKIDIPLKTLHEHWQQALEKQLEGKSA